MDGLDKTVYRLLRGIDCNTQEEGYNLIIDAINQYKDPNVFVQYDGDNSIIHLLDEVIRTESDGISKIAELDKDCLRQH